MLHQATAHPNQISEIKQINKNQRLGVSLRAGLYAHTARALATGPVSAAIPNAEKTVLNHD
jgi:hypothetical protein